MCTTFINYFTSKIQAIHGAIISKLSSLPAPIPDLTHTGPTLDLLSPVTPYEASVILNSLPVKSSALDFVSTSLIKSCSGVFSILTAKLANLSFAQGTFPASFKHALVTPILKKPGLPSSDPGNFRPISNLNNISKILERLFLSRLLPTHQLEL